MPHQELDVIKKEVYTSKGEDAQFQKVTLRLSSAYSYMKIQTGLSSKTLGEAIPIPSQAHVYNIPVYYCIACALSPSGVCNP